MRKTALVVGFTTGALFGLGGAAHADTIRVPRDASLQQAVESARPGDRIVVRGEHFWAGNLELDADAVTLIGRRAKLYGDLVIHGDDVKMRGFTVGGDLVVDGDNVLVKRNHFVHGSAQLAGDGGLLTRNRFTNTAAIIAAHVTHEGNTVSRNRFKDSMCAIVAEADDTTIANNRVNDAIEAGVVVVGDDAQVDHNTIRDVDLMDGITVIGDDSDISDNRVQGAPGGIRVEGDGPAITDNRVDAGFEIIDADIGLVPGCPGITVVSDEPGGVIDDNVVRVINGTGVHVEGEGVAITDNVVRNRGIQPRTNIEVSGDDHTVTGNRVAQDPDPTDIRTFPMMTPGFWDSTTAHGIAVNGNDNHVEQNRVDDTTGSGVVAEGNRNAVCRNTVQDTEGHAIAVDGNANLIEDNVVRDPQLDGILVSGWSTTVADNRVRGAEGCGILMNDPGTVSNCDVTDCGMGGLVNHGDGTRVIDSEFSANTPFDVANTGTFESFEGNRARNVTDDPNAIPPHDIQAPFPIWVPQVEPLLGIGPRRPTDPGQPGGTEFEIDFGNRGRSAPGLGF